MISLPGLIDVHVHLREPGATHKEDFDSGTRAALAGGFTTVLCMPNTTPPITDSTSLEVAKRAATEKARCDYGIFAGAGPENPRSLQALARTVCGLKLYLDQTYGPLRLDSLELLQAHMQAWPKDKPISAHAEGRSLAAVILLAAVLDRRVHICHVSRKEEILLIRAAKEKSIPVTCEVTPHHLFLDERDAAALGPGRSEVRPRLARPEDRQALWENMEVIDCFATDHAPHTLQEKDGDNPPPGFPGLETALGLWLEAVREGRLSLEQVASKAHYRPREIFGLPEQVETEVEIDPQASWEVKAASLQTRCGWTPFEGMRLHGRVRRVRLRGQIAYEEDEIRVPRGYGRDIYSS